MSVKHKILVVDDEPMNREIMEEILMPDYEVELAESGIECLELARKLHPMAILLDINMPGMSGYEVCNKLKRQPDTANIPVTFVSALDTLAERLTGYEVGADEYITKPFEAGELLQKLKVVINNHQNQSRLQQIANTNLGLANQEVSGAGELGVVLQFLRESFHVEDLGQLADKAVHALASYGLRSTVQIRCGTDHINRSSDGTINPLETTVIARIYQEKKILDIGQRTLFNFDRVSILAQGMPAAESEQYKRFKDHLALLTEGCAERVKAILAQAELDKKQDGLSHMLDSTRRALATIDATHEEHKIKSIRILSDLIIDVESSFSRLGLSEEQQDSFMEMINRAVNSTIELYNDGLDIESRLKSVVEDVKDVIDQSQDVSNY